jgi:hypothetical protein
VRKKYLTGVHYGWSYDLRPGNDLTPTIEIRAPSNESVTSIAYIFPSDSALAVRKRRKPKNTISSIFLLFKITFSFFGAGPVKGEK